MDILVALGREPLDEGRAGEAGAEGEAESSEEAEEGAAVIRWLIALFGIVGLLALLPAGLYFIAWMLLMITRWFPLVGRRFSVPNARTSREPLKDSLSASRDQRMVL
jgi:hypothetical protein